MTAKGETLEGIVAHFLGIAPEAVVTSTPLSGTLGSSLGRAQLDAAVRRRLGITLRNCYGARTFGELQASANRKGSAVFSSSAARTEPDSPHGRAQINAVGFDLQSAEELPDAADYWSHPFYGEHFTATEIAAGQLHPQPRMHYAGLWCAKEALKKANPALIGCDWKEIEVRRGTDGCPSAYAKRGNEWQQLFASISITHTGNVAGAVAIFHANNNCPLSVPPDGPEEGFQNRAEENSDAPLTAKSSSRLVIAAVAFLLVAIVVLVWIGWH